MAWIDSATGQSYESGYYDENGRRYDNVAYAKDGQYENVICHCPFCDHESILTLSATEPTDKSLACPNCGGTMEIRSALDDYLEPGYDDVSRSGGSYKKRHTGRNVLIGFIVAILALIGLGAYSGRFLQEETTYEDPYYEDTVPGTGDSYDSVITLTRTGDNSYQISDGGSEDKTLVWDDEADSYYDEESDCWVWLNTDVEPAVWQYWYEGVSSDFEASGWMEHYEDGWFIEADIDDWIALPEQYDSGSLWYIE